MPVVSQAQNSFMHACRAGTAMDNCPPKKVVDEFLNPEHGKHRIRNLPEHVKPPKVHKNDAGEVDIR